MQSTNNLYFKGAKFMKKLFNYIKIKNVFEFLSSELIITLSQLKNNSSFSFRDIIYNWEKRIENGKIWYGSQNIKKDIVEIFSNDGDADTILSIMGNEIANKKIKTIEKILELDIQTNDKIKIIDFLIKESANELSDEFLLN